MTKTRMRASATSVTADDVARKAGVSRWTVTRAFKQGASISPAKRELVLKAAEELDYAPDLLATSLASSRSGLVALLMDDFENPHKLPVLQHLTEALQGEGIASILLNINDAQTPAMALMNASQRRVEAAVLIGASFSDDIVASAMAGRKPEHLVVFARESAVEGSVSISCDNDVAVREMTRFAVDHGYRRTLFVAGPKTLPTPLKRRDTFLQAMVEAGCPRPDLVHIGQYSQPDAKAAVLKELGEGSTRPELIFCENDVMALGAIDAVRARGLRVPDDIGVMGFDNIAAAQSSAYDLTTYDQPLAAMVRRLIEVLNGEWAGTMQHLFPGELVVRGSTRNLAEKRGS